MPSAGEFLRDNMQWRARGLHGSVSRLALLGAHAAPCTIGVAGLA
jgi:hypothetical protein